MTNAESQPVLGSDWVDAHADYLFNFAIGQVRDANTAEDLVQDTFLAAVKAQNSFGGKSSARTWLVGILRHKIYDHLRKTCRERAVRHDPTPMNDGESWEESALWLHDVAAELNCPAAGSSWTNSAPIWNWRSANCPHVLPRHSNSTKSKSARTAKSASN